jgi:hypothetical protein
MPLIVVVENETQMKSRGPWDSLRIRDELPRQGARVRPRTYDGAMIYAFGSTRAGQGEALRPTRRLSWPPYRE